MALYQSLKAFRNHYEQEEVTLVSDGGDNFSDLATYFNINYHYSSYNCKYGQLGLIGSNEYLRRIYEHCVRANSDYVVILEEDVLTRRRINQFPSTEAAGPRLNVFSEALIQYLKNINHNDKDYGYGMCGGSIFDRKIYVECYEKRDFDLRVLGKLDQRIIMNKDALLAIIFLVNGFSYSIWGEVSETKNPIKSRRIIRDSAFDHKYKDWYGVEFDERLLDDSSCL